MLAISWSSVFHKCSGDVMAESLKCTYSILAVALKSGHIALWSVRCPATDARSVCSLSFKYLVCSVESKNYRYK